MTINKHKKYKYINTYIKNDINQLSNINTNTNDINQLSNSINNLDINLDKAVIYVRCSTPGQNKDHNYSLETQEGICRDFCNNRFIVTNIVSEIVSARDINRQQQLLDLIDNSSDINLIVADASRLSRDFTNSINLIEKCKEKNICIYSARDNLDIKTFADKKMFVNNLLLAQYESDMTSFRIKTSIAHRKRIGKFIPRPSYGFKIQNINGNKSMVKNDTEVKVIQLIKKLYLGSKIKDIQNLLKEITESDNSGSSLMEIENNQFVKIKEVKEGNFTFSDIAHILNEENITNKNKKWTCASVRRVFIK